MLEDDDTPQLEELITYRLMQLADTIRTAASQAYSEAFDITVPELRILGTVSSRQPISVNEVSRVTRIDKGWISRSVRDLLERGLITREPHSKDRRIRLLSLTPEGTALVRRIWPYSRARNEWFLAGLDGAALHQLFDILQPRADMLLEAGKEAAVPDRFQEHLTTLRQAPPKMAGPWASTD